MIAAIRMREAKSRATLKIIQSLFGLLQFVSTVAPTAKLFTLVESNPNSLHSEWKSSDILENPHLVRALSCQISLLKSTLFLTCLKLHYTTNIGISLERPEDSHAVSRRVRISWDLKKVQFNFVLLTGIYSDF